MTFITTIEIDEIEKQVSIEFKNHFGDIEVHEITELETGNAIDADIDDYTYNEMAQMYADLVADAGRFGS